MMGHTIRSTINTRRPLTQRMTAVLGDLVRIGRINHADLDQGNANAMKALCDRGYVDWHIETRGYTITLEGRSALTGKEGRTDG